MHEASEGYELGHAVTVFNGARTYYGTRDACWKA